MKIEEMEAKLRTMAYLSQFGCYKKKLGAVPATRSRSLEVHSSQVDLAAVIKTDRTSDLM